MFKQNNKQRVRGDDPYCLGTQSSTRLFIYRDVAQCGGLIGKSPHLGCGHHAGSNPVIPTNNCRRW